MTPSFGILTYNNSMFIPTALLAKGLTLEEKYIFRREQITFTVFKALSNI